MRALWHPLLFDEEMEIEVMIRIKTTNWTGPGQSQYAISVGLLLNDSASISRTIRATIPW
jgi:hypothetical protein